MESKADVKKSKRYICILGNIYWYIHLNTRVHVLGDVCVCVCV